jgi:hypothetical protein
MVKDSRESEVLIDLCALPTDQNKGFKSLTDHGVETPTVGCSNASRIGTIPPKATPLRTARAAVNKLFGEKPEEVTERYRRGISL